MPCRYMGKQRGWHGESVRHGQAARKGWVYRVRKVRGWGPLLYWLKPVASANPRSEFMDFRFRKESLGADNNVDN